MSTGPGAFARARARLGAAFRFVATLAGAFVCVIAALVLVFLVLDLRTAPPAVAWYRQSAEPDVGDKTVVVFVHGARGDSVSTWTGRLQTTETLADDCYRDDAAKKSGTLYWPALVMCDRQVFGDKTDVFVYGYSSPLVMKGFSLPEIASNLRSLMDQNRLYEYREIIFVGHSLGGLVLREFMIDDADDPVNPGLYSNMTRLVLTLASPYQGAWIGFLSDLIPSLNTHVFDARMGSTELIQINKRWLPWTAQRPRPRAPLIYCAYERGMIVSHNSAAEGCDTSVPMDSNHVETAKPVGLAGGPHSLLRLAYRSSTPLSNASTLVGISDGDASAQRAPVPMPHGGRWVEFRKAPPNPRLPQLTDDFLSLKRCEVEPQGEGRCDPWPKKEEPLVLLKQGIAVECRYGGRLYAQRVDGAGPRAFELPRGTLSTYIDAAANQRRLAHPARQGYLKFKLNDRPWPDDKFMVVDDNWALTCNDKPLAGGLVSVQR